MKRGKPHKRRAQMRRNAKRARRNTESRRDKNKSKAAIVASNIHKLYRAMGGQEDNRVWKKRNYVV